MGCFWKDLVQTTCDPTPIIPSSSYALYATGNMTGLVNSSSFALIPGEPNIKQVSSGTDFNIILNDQDVIRGIGNDFSDQLLTSTFSPVTSWVDVLSNITLISAGAESISAIDISESIKGTGFGSVDVATGLWSQVIAGSYYFFAIDTSGDTHVYRTLSNQLSNSLGMGAIVSNFTLTQVGINGYTKISTGESADASGTNAHTAVLTPSGEIFVTGGNFKGELGLGDNTDRTSFVSAGTGFIDISCGRSSTFAIKTNGDLVATGIGGALGTGDASDRNTFTTVGTGFSKLPAQQGLLSSFAFKGSDMYATGEGTSGQLGLGDSLDKLVWELVGSGFHDVACSGGSTIALK